MSKNKMVSKVFDRIINKMNILISDDCYRNLSFGLATKARACKGVSQE